MFFPDMSVTYRAEKFPDGQRVSVQIYTSSDAEPVQVLADLAAAVEAQEEQQ
jgi:hypothetical protein